MFATSTTKKNAAAVFSHAAMSISYPTLLVNIQAILNFEASSQRNLPWETSVRVQILLTRNQIITDIPPDWPSMPQYFFTLFLIHWQ